VVLLDLFSWPCWAFDKRWWVFTATCLQ